MHIPYVIYIMTHLGHALPNESAGNVSVTIVLHVPVDIENIITWVITISGQNKIFVWVAPGLLRRKG